MYRRFKTEISYAVSPFLHRTRLYVSHLKRLCFWDDEADLNLCRFWNCFRGKETFCFGRTKVYHAVATNAMLGWKWNLTCSGFQPKESYLYRRSGMLLVSHLGRHSMVHSHGFNIDDTVSNLKNTRTRPFFVCSKPCSTSTAPNVAVVGGTFRWNSGVRGSPNWFFWLKARRRPQHVPRIPIPEGST